MILSLSQPRVVGSRPARRLPSLSGSRLRTIVRVGSFDESAAQVRRLVDRDRKELDYDALEDSFKADPPKDGSNGAEAAAASSSAAAAGTGPTPTMTSFTTDLSDKTPVSPFGPSSSSSTPPSPFGSSGSSLGGGASFARKPFAEPAGLRPDMPPANIKQEPWWTKITLTQIVIVLSFTTIIASMIATFFFVLSTGAVHFND